MPVTHVHRCLPRAGIDPIDRVAAARLLATAVRRPLRHETIVLLLDAERRGVAMVVVGGTDDPDSVIEIGERLAAPSAHDGRVAAMVIATVRPGPPDPRPPAPGAASRSDVERWMEVSDLADAAGVEVIEWFTIHPDGVSCPRDQLGEPPRW